MSVKLMSLSWKLTINSTSKIVLLALADRSNDDGECFLLISTLKEKCSLSERAVQNSLSFLEKNGLITRSIRKGRSNIFTINADSLTNFQPALDAPTNAPHAPTPAPHAPTPAPHAPIYVSYSSLNHKSKLTTFSQWIDSCKKNAIKPIPDDSSIHGYAEKIGLPRDYLILCWDVFKDRYRQDGKKYIDWHRVFCKAVKENWFKLWWINDAGKFQLTTTGNQSMMEHNN